MAGVRPTIRHCSSNAEQGGFLASKLCDPFLQCVCRAILTIDIVSDGSASHQVMHLLVWDSDGIACKIEDQTCRKSHDGIYLWQAYYGSLAG